MEGVRCADIDGIDIGRVNRFLPGVEHVWVSELTRDGFRRLPMAADNRGKLGLAGGNVGW